MIGFIIMMLLNIHHVQSISIKIPTKQQQHPSKTMLPIHHHHQNSNPIKKGKVNIGKSSAEWRSRSIYQIITDRFSPSESGSGKSCPLLYTYCGGTFQGITSHLNYVKSLGFNAIWISPIVLNLPGGYHGKLWNY